MLEIMLQKYHKYRYNMPSYQRLARTANILANADYLVKYIQI
jgi:hypothetical protein